MKIPFIKHLVDFIEKNDVDYLHETIEVLESLADVPTLKDEEMEVIGELISNLYGAIEVQKEISNGAVKKDALNGFMKRVLGSIN
jgi:predicted metal-dependent hydrolase